MLSFLDPELPYGYEWMNWKKLVWFHWNHYQSANINPSPKYLDKDWFWSLRAGENNEHFPILQILEFGKKGLSSKWGIWPIGHYTFSTPKPEVVRNAGLTLEN